MIVFPIRETGSDGGGRSICLKERITCHSFERGDLCVKELVRKVQLERFAVRMIFLASALVILYVSSAAVVRCNLK